MILIETKSIDCKCLHIKSEGWWRVGEQKHGNRSGVAECQLAHGMMALRAGKTSIAVCTRTTAA